MKIDDKKVLIIYQPSLNKWLLILIYLVEVFWNRDLVALRHQVNIDKAVVLITQLSDAESTSVDDSVVASSTDASTELLQ